jgi:hypothetical protein
MFRLTDVVSLVMLEMRLRGGARDANPALGP